jgi:LysM repeat protein
MSLAWDLEHSPSVTRPYLSLVTDSASERSASEQRSTRRLATVVVAVVAVVILVLLALPIRSFGGRTLAQTPPTVGQEYVVKAGDTLTSIARQADPGRASSLAARLAGESGAPVVVPGEHLFIP